MKDNNFKYLIIGIILVAILHIAYQWKISNHYTHDDAYISFRYAENWTKGEGLVYNEGEKCEGYSNFLWTVLIAFFMLFDINPVTSSFVISIIFCLVTIFLTYKISLLLFQQRKYLALIPPLILALHGSFIFHNLTGLETIFFCFLITLSLYFFVKDKDSTKVPFSLGLVALARADGFVFFLIFVLYKLIFDRKKFFRLKFFIKSLLPFFIIYLPYLSWKYFYYGEILPNSYYAKVGSSLSQYLRGLKYFGEFLLANGILFLLPLLFFLIFRKKIYYLLFTFLMFALYIIYVGGDYSPGHRFFVPILPMLYILIKESLLSVEKKYSKTWQKNTFFKRSLILLVTIISGLFAGLYTFKRGYGLWEVAEILNTCKMTKDGKIIGEYFNKIAKPNEVIAANTAGTLAFYSKLKFIDMLGINDKYIARQKSKWLGKFWPGHEKCASDYVLSRKPEYIILGYSSFTKPMLPSDVELANKEEFLRNYEPVIVPIRLNYAPCFIYYRRLLREDKNNKDLVSQLRKIPKNPLRKEELKVSIEMIKDVAYRYIQKGWLLFNEGDLDWSEISFRKGLNLDKNLKEGWYCLAEVLYKKGKHAEAKEACQKALRIDPDFKFAKRLLQKL